MAKSIKIQIDEKDIQKLVELGFEYKINDNVLIKDGQWLYSLNDERDIMELHQFIQEYEYQQGLLKLEEEYGYCTNTFKIKVKERTHEILPTHSDVMTNTTSKQYNTLGMLVCKSNFNKKSNRMEAYLYEKDLENKLDELKAEGIKIPCLKTIKRHIKELTKITIGDNSEQLIRIENTPNGIVYKIQQNYNGKYFVSIPCKQLKELLIGTNNNILKLFCIFNYKCIETEWTPITRSYLCKGMGLTEGESSENYISIAIGVLKKLGYIKVKTEHLTIIDDNGKLIPHDRNYYKLTTFEEWENKK